MSFNENISFNALHGFQMANKTITNEEEMKSEWLQYRLTMLDKKADAKDPWMMIQYKGKLKEYEKEY